jgi:hypothetical protein
VPRSLADFVEVVVLAAGAQTFLRRAGAHVIALLVPEKHVFELIHARVGEQQRRIVGGQKGRRAHTRVAVPFEILKEFFANFVSSHKKAEVRG